MDVRHENIKSEFSIRYRTNLSRHYTHWHQRMEFLLIDKGCFTVTIQGTAYRAKPGDILVIRTGQIHDIAPDDENCAAYISTFKALLIYTFLSSMVYPHSHITREELEEAGICEEITRLFKEMDEERTKMLPCHDILVQSRILQVYGLLVRYFEADSVPQEKNPGKFTDFQAALSYISDNFRHPITLTDIAHQLNYSTSYVSAMFVAYIGVNYKAYLDSIRISEASWLLQSTSQSISQISSSCGFDNIRTFNNVFRRITGFTPSEFRKRL